MKLKQLVIPVFFASSLSATASAQEPAWLSDRTYREGPGILVGNFELHPGVGVDFGYDSNYFHRAGTGDATAPEPIVGALRLRASPAFSVATLGPRRRADGSNPTVGFRFEVGATYNEFIPVSGSQGDKDALRRQRNAEGLARISLDILPGRSWSGRIYAFGTRAIRPTQEGITGSSFNRWLPGGGAEIAFTPGSGMLDWRIGDEVSATLFESTDFSSLNNIHNDAYTRGRWRFLPRTALIYEGRFGYITYPKGTSAATNKTSSHPVRARFGATGLITPSFGLLATIGWGASFYTGKAQTDLHDFNSVLAQAELKWYLTPSDTLDPMKVNPLLSGIAVGFVRDFEDSFIGTYLEKDQGYINFSYLFGGRFLLSANVAVGAIVFPKQASPDLGQPNGWTDLRVDGKLFMEYRAKDWLGINAEADYVGYFSKTALAFPNVSGRDPIAYQKVAAFGGARVFW